jgi:hypothetical protein
MNRSSLGLPYLYRALTSRLTAAANEGEDRFAPGRQHFLFPQVARSREIERYAATSVSVFVLFSAYSLDSQRLQQAEDRWVMPSPTRARS